jgi:PAS domain S-box-containing protein
MKYPLARGGRRFAIFLSVLSVAIMVAGYRYHSIQKANLNEAVEQGLRGIAAAKAQAVQQWRGQRIADGLSAMQQSRIYAESWAGLKSGRADFSPEAREWLGSFVPGGYQRVVVLTTAGEAVYPQRRPASDVTPDASEAIAAAVRTAQPALTEFHPSPGERPDLHADLVVPVFSPAKAVVGVVLLYNEVEETLAVLVKPSQLIVRSLETALVRKDADSARYLRFGAESEPMLLTIPQSAGATDATLRGEEGEFECVDYRGREVLAATAAIPDSKWQLLAKVDADDVRRQVAVRERSILLIILLLAAVTALGAGFAWRTGTTSLYRELYEAEVRARALTGHYGYLSRYSNDLIFLSDENGVIIEANERCESALAITRKDLIGRRFQTLVSESGRASFEEGWASAIKQDGAIFESELLRHERGPLPVEISARALSVDGRKFMQAIARDITERKRGQEDWRGILRTTTDAFCAVDAAGRLVEVNDKYVEIAGIPREQLVGLSMVHPNPSIGLPDFQQHLAVLRKSGADRWETRYRRPDGRTFDLDVSAQYLRASGRGFAFIRDITAIKQALRDLEQSQRMVSRVVRTMPDLLYIFDVRQRQYAFVNKALEEFFGWARLPIEARRSRLIHPDDLEFVTNNYKVLAHTPESAISDIEFRAKRADGVWRRLRAREVVFSRTDDGQVLEVLGIAEDITEQVEAAEQIRRANALLSATFNASPLAKIVNDLDGRVLHWNAAAEQMFGWREQEVLGLPVPFIDEVERLAHIGEVVAGHTFRGVDVTRRRKDGSAVDVSIWTAPIRGSSGEITAILGVLMDITEQKRARAELEKSRALLMRAHHMASLGSWTANLETGAAEWADETYAMFGYGRGEVSPGWDTYLAAVHPEDRVRVEPWRYPPLDGPQPFRWDHRVLRPDGSIRHVRQSAVVIRDANGKPVHLAGTVQDVTEYKVLEEQLRQAQKLETVGRLAGGIAHDFNNLLTVINGYGELLLQQTAGDSFLQKGLSEILGAGERAAELTKNLLTFSRKQVLEIKPVDLNSTISGMQSMLSRLIGDDVTLDLDLCETQAPVMGDPVQLQQILLNLAVNARDAMPTGGTLRITTLLPRPDEVLLSVSDTGTGMTEDVRSHLFEPFFTTKEPGKGTGLGLSTVYGIVKQGGGTIAVDTASGCGTTFRIYFPLASPPALDSPSSNARVTHGGGASVLVVEDQDDVRQLLITMLTELGYRPVATRDGESALREFSSSIDVLISDVLMPGMNGFDLFQALRATRPGLGVLFISGYAPDPDSDEAAWPDWGGCFLPKPFTRETLARKLGEVLQKARRAALAS